MHRTRTRAGILAVLALSAAMVGCRGSDETTNVAEKPTATDAPAATDGGEATATTAPAAGGETPSSSECTSQDPGVTDTEVILGGTYPLSGPAAAYGAIPVGLKAYFDYLNDTNGGITFGDGKTRKVTWTYLDDQYSPPKALENVRKLIEQDGVFLILNSLGTPNNLAIREYMNEAQVPQLFVSTGASVWGSEHETYPWTIGWQPDYMSEGIAYGQHILNEKPDAKVAVVMQNDDFGKDNLHGLERVLGDQITTLVTYEVTDAQIDNQISQAVDSGADAIVLLATPKFAIQGIQRLAALGYEGIKVVSSVSASVGAVVEPAGAEAATGFVTSGYLKDPTDPLLQDDPGILMYKEILGKYAPGANPEDGMFIFGMNVAMGMQHVFESLETICRSSVMHAAENLNIEVLPLNRDGIGAHTGPGDYFPIQQVLLVKWDGESWVQFGDVIDTGIGG